MKNTKLSKTQSSQTYAQFYAYVHSKARRPRSREVYLRWVERIGEHYRRDGPGLRRLSERQVLDYLIYLRDDQKLAASTVNQALVSIRMLHRDVPGREWKLWSQFELQRLAVSKMNQLIRHHSASVVATCPLPATALPDAQYVSTRMIRMAKWDLVEDRKELGDDRPRRPARNNHAARC